jgi:hypothetical protein
MTLEIIELTKHKGVGNSCLDSASENPVQANFMGSYWLGQEHAGGKEVNSTLFRGIDGLALLVAEQLQSLAKKGENGAN